MLQTKKFKVVFFSLFIDFKSPIKFEIDAARQANAHDFIMGFPNGYDTFVGEHVNQFFF